MARPRVYKTEAIVLKRSNLGEADTIITLYTPNLGKIRAVAKGARRLHSKLGGHLDLLTRSDLLLAQGQNLDIITQSQTIESFLPMRNDLKLISSAIYMAELLDQFTAEQVENYPVYILLNNDLLWLCGARDPYLVLRHFELQLLNHMGYQPELHHCLGCKSPLMPQENLFSAGNGGIFCPTCARNEPMVRAISVDAVKVIRFLLDNNQVNANRLRMSGDLSREVEQLIRWYIRYILEREVKSVEFLDHIQEKDRFYKS
ncbi:MAG: DNA repair protein RecO [Dehalococcoidia bacterium]|nr:DNA repair protein RecO [Dehalococcoidia bacterium]